MPDRLIAIGDVHGCIDALNALLKAIQPTPQDTLVMLGDLVDRGPDSKAVIDVLLELKKTSNLIAIQGNHEQMMLDTLAGESPQWWLQYGGVETLDSYGFTGDFNVIPQSHLDFFEAMVDYYEADDVFFTHAAYHHETPLDCQPAEFLRWYSLRAGCPPPHVNGKICFVGHTAQKNGEIGDFGHLVAVDTYCYGGQWLTGIDVRTRQTWQADKTGQIRLPDG